MNNLQPKYFDQKYNLTLIVRMFILHGIFLNLYILMIKTSQVYCKDSYTIASDSTDYQYQYMLRDPSMEKQISIHTLSLNNPTLAPTTNCNPKPIMYNFYKKDQPANNLQYTIDFNEEQSKFTFKLGQTSNITLVSDYTLQLLSFVQFSDQSSLYHQSTVNLTVREDCKYAPIQVKMLVSTTNFQFLQGSSRELLIDFNKIFKMTTWYFCTLIVELKYTNTSSLNLPIAMPKFINFYSETQKASFFPAVEEYAGQIYNLQLIMYSTSLNEANVFKYDFSIKYVCTASQVVIPTQFTSFDYKVTSPGVVYPILRYYLNKNCTDADIQYTLTKISSPPISTGDAIFFDIENMFFRIQTDEWKDVGSYEYKLKGSVIINGKTIQSSQSFKFKISMLQSGNNNTAPSFKSALQDLTVGLGSTTNQQLPEIIDQENDQYVIGLTTTSPIFITINNKKLIIKPTLKEHLITFQVGIVLTDKNQNSMSQIFQFNLRVTSDSNEAEAQSYLSVTNKGFTFQGVVVDFNKIKGTVSSIIDSISMRGVITLKFSEQMLIPKTFDQFYNFNALKIQIRKPNGDIENLQDTNKVTGSASSNNNRLLDSQNQTAISNITNNKTKIWEITNYQSNQMRIKIAFPNPLNISQSQDVIILKNKQLIGV
eukprot:403346386